MPQGFGELKLNPDLSCKKHLKKNEFVNNRDFGENVLMALKFEWLD